MTENQQAQVAAEILADKVVNAAVASTDLPGITHATKAEVKEALVEETTQVVINQLNQEPWYQSRILVTQYITLAVTLLGVFGYVVTPEYRDQIIAAILAVGAVVTPLITIAARLWGKKPMTLFKNAGGN